MIRITGWKEEQKIYFKVEDNGIGMSRDNLKQLQKSICGTDGEVDNSGFGLANVNQRLQYYYGEEYGVFFDSEENEGTVATVIIGVKK
ncbi:MAG TPA: hypothetical protein DCX82_13985 [Lachnospiraceae bacterium]|nr:hypothetical protein [Lachnospiraceae bacterium]